MFALIDPTRGNLVVDVRAEKFDVAAPFFWDLAPDGTVANTHTLTGGVLALTPEAVARQQPVTIVPTSCTPLTFINKFTDAEQLAIVTATLSVPQIKLFYDKLLASQEVVFNDPRLSAGLSALVAAGLLTQERMDVVLPPSLRSSGVTVL